MSASKSRNSHQKRELKNQLCKKYGSKCQICEKFMSLELLTLDHIIPLADNGSWNIKNLQLACYPCNQEKADTNPRRSVWDRIASDVSK